MSSQAADNGKNEANLPKFMNEKSKINYIEDIEAGQSWLTNNLHRLMIGVSIVWFLIVLIYITQFFGWSNLFLMMPDEFGGFLAGVTLPLAIIWVVMAYIDRGSSFKQEAKFLRAYMNQLVYPEDGGANTAKAMADAIRSQVVELQEVTKLATEQTEKIKNELGGRVNDFSKLVKVLDNYSSNTIVELTEGVRILINSFESVNDKAASSTEVFKGYISEFSGSAITIQNQFDSLFGTLQPKMQEIKNSSQALQSINDESNAKMLKTQELISDFTDRAGKNIMHLSELLSNQTTRLEQVSQTAVNNCSEIYKDLNSGIDNLENTLRSQSRFVVEYVENLDTKSDALVKKFSEHGEIIGLEVEKVLARANVIEDSIATQVSELNGVADGIESNLKNVEESISSQIVKLEKQADAAVGEFTIVVNAIDDKTQKLGELSSYAIRKTGEVSDELSLKNQNLQKISDNIVSNLKQLNQELSDNTISLQKQSEISINSFNEVGSVMKKHADGLTEASSIVVAQSKVSEISLAQQQRSINASIGRVEEVKAELKRQIDELTRAATIIDDEATSSADKLKKQLTDTLKSCEDVISKTKHINDNLAEQASNFDNSTNKTLAKVNQFEAVLNSKAEQLDSVSKNVVGRAVEVENILDKNSKLIDKSTENANVTFKELQNSFEAQSGLLSSVAENTISYVSDVVQALDDKAEAINLLFKHQENEFFGICDKISENTNSIGSSLKKQISTIEQSADRIFARMAMLEEDVNKRAESVVQNSTKSIERLSEIDGSIANQNQEVNKFMTEITEKLSLISESFRHNIQSFSHTVKEIRDETSVVTGDMLSNCNKIKEANQDVANESKNISGQIENHIKNLDISLIKARTQAESIKDTFEQQKETLIDVVNVVATQTRLGEASLAQQYKVLSDVSTEVAQKLSDINNKFKSNTDNVLDASTKVAYEFDVLGDRLLKVGDDINKASKSSIQNVEQVNMALGQCSDDLSLSVNNSVNKVSGVMQEYEKYIASFNTVTAEASTGVVEINNLITQQSDKMIKISEDTKQLVECFNTVLNDTSLELSNRANHAFEKVKGLGENLKNLSLQLEETTKMSSTHFDNSGNKLRATIGEIASNAERISNEIRSSGEVFLKQSEALVATTEDTLKKVGGVMDSLNNGADDFANRGDDIVKRTVNFNEVVNKQVQILSETAQKADIKLSDLEKRYASVRIDTFLKDASNIIEQLENLSVDVNRIFNPNVEEELWKRYYNGDSSAFVRYLAKTMTKQQVIAIRNLFEQNLEFRNLVSKYLNEFENLISKARSNERSGILLSVISGADIGKIYYILAKALDKIN